MTNDRMLYQQLIEPMESRMMRSIWRVVRRPELAEDALQDALTTIWKKLDQIQSHPNPEALILRICLNSACDALRKRKRFLRYEEPNLPLSLPDKSKASAPDILESREVENEVLDAIRRLPEKQATAVLMRLVQDEPFDVIAQALGCSEVTVRIHVSKGRARLRRFLAHLNPCSPEEPSQ